MDLHEQEWQAIRQNRLNRAKKWLRYLPKRSTFARYKFLRWFGDGLLKRRYLWSFKYEAVRPALYAGWILTLLPVMGAQTLIASILAVIFRANIMILVALQMISNPLTVGLLWPFEYKVGEKFLKLLDGSNQLGLNVTAREILGHGSIGYKGACFLKITLAIVIGAIILGYICGAISCYLYKYFTQRNAITYQQFLLSKEREASKNQKHPQSLHSNSKK
ncbi:MAG: DUF2062 domain-containing protein [Puniceicoccales bacterium]|jgi:uncharacterized protein (DUF2062 family)|nr:DUF2062 domain-containing protein [Puniceicoccales bacterium]